MEITQKDDVTAYACADDIVIGSKSLTKLQNTIDDVEKWCTQHTFKINTEKTEMMVFRTEKVHYESGIDRCIVRMSNILFIYYFGRLHFRRGIAWFTYVKDCISCFIIILELNIIKWWLGLRVLHIRINAHNFIKREAWIDLCQRLLSLLL